MCAHTAWACIVYTSEASCMHLSVSNLLLSQSILKAIREYREHVYSYVYVFSSKQDLLILCIFLLQLQVLLLAL